MAIETKIGGDYSLFIGEDKRLRFGPLSKPSGWNDSLQGVWAPQDLSLRSLRFVAKKKDSDPDTAAIIDRPVNGFIGVFSATASANKQQAYIDLTDSELSYENFKPQTESSYRYALKMEDDPETILAAGDFEPQLASARD